MMDWFGKLQLAASLILAVLVALLEQSTCQKLPTRDENHFHFQISQAEIFYDTKLLPDGAEVTAFLYKDIQKRYFFIVEEDNTPLSITVTPCASALDWNISIHDLPEEKSGDGPEAEDDQTLEQKKMAKEVAPPLSSVLQMNTSDDVMTYRTAASPAGIYMLEIKAVTSDSSLKMYATTTPDSDHAYPELPSDSDVDILSVSKNTVVLAWKPSPTERVHGQPVQYCLSANKVKNFKTMCAAHGWIFGDQPPTVPPNAGFGFSWEKDFKSGSKDMSSPIKPIGLDQAFFTCIGSKTRFSFNQAVPGEHYYFDIFAVNKLTNRSIAYNGCNVKTKEHFKHVSLKDGKVLRAFLKRSRGGKIFTLDLAHFTKELIFAVEPCAGNLKIQIGKKRKVLKTAIVRGLKSFRFSNVYPGKYKLKVWSSRKRSTSFNVLATTKSSRFPYPKLANDTRIKSFDNLRTCNSVTLAWLGTEKRMQYCLYKRKEPNRLKRLFSRRGGSCTDPSTRKKNEKILCRHFRYKAKNRGVLTETVRELQPNTTYVFDVYVSKSRGQTLKYQSAWVTTRSRC